MRFYLLTIILSLNNIFIFTGVFSQVIRTFADTSYFESDDDNFNLIAAADLGRIDHVILLLSRGADINASTYEGVTALMYASNNGNLEMIEYLYDHGAEVNKQPLSGISALIAAAQSNHLDAAEFLITHGASPDMRDIYGVTAVHYAAAYNHYEMVDMLIFYGADPDMPDYEENTPLITASYNNCYEAADILLQNRATITARDNKGFTALMAAVQENNYDITDLLLEKGSDINAISKTGVSALILAVRAGNYEMCEKLINKGALYDPFINGNIDVIQLAEQNKNDRILELLTENGIKSLKTPNFNRICFGPSINLNSTDYMNGIKIGLLDSKYNTGVYTGFSFRPSAIRILNEFNSDTIFQYWERRYYFYTGAEKRFAVWKGKSMTQTGSFIGINGILTYGGYRGSYEKPGMNFIFSPLAGWYFMNKNILVNVSYEHINFKTKEIQPGRINVTGLFTINLNKRKLTEKQIIWLTN